MELSIEVREGNIQAKHGTSRKTGKPYSIYEQTGLVSLPTGETRKVTLQPTI